MDKNMADRYHDMALLSACRLIGISLDELNEYDPLHQFYIIFSTVQLFFTYKGEDPVMPLFSYQYGDEEALEAIYEDTKKLACLIAGLNYEDFDEYDPRHQFYICLATLQGFTAANKGSDAKKQERKISISDEDLDTLGIEIYKNLMEWRNREADYHNQPRYTVLSNMTLRNIAWYKPKTLNDLLCIKGIGLKIQNKYGHQILNIVRESCKIEEEEVKSQNCCKFGSGYRFTATASG